ALRLMTTRASGSRSAPRMASRRPPPEAVAPPSTTAITATLVPAEPSGSDDTPHILPHPALEYAANGLDRPSTFVDPGCAALRRGSCGFATGAPPRPVRRFRSTPKPHTAMTTAHHENPHLRIALYSHDALGLGH